MLLSNNSQVHPTTSNPSPNPQTVKEIKNDRRSLQGRSKRESRIPGNLDREKTHNDTKLENVKQPLHVEESKQQTVVCGEKDSGDKAVGFVESETTTGTSVSPTFKCTSSNSQGEELQQPLQPSHSSSTTSSIQEEITPESKPNIPSDSQLSSDQEVPSSSTVSTQFASAHNHDARSTTSSANVNVNFPSVVDNESEIQRVPSDDSCASLSQPDLPTKLPKPALKSSLKSSLKQPHSKTAGFHTKPSTERRVRGLWSDTSRTNCHLSKLREETIVHIFGFLNLADLTRVSMVSQRYRSIVQTRKILWNRLDATEYVHTAYETFLKQTDSTATAQKETGRALETILTTHRPRSLTIRNIGDCLSASYYLPSLDSFQELCLTGFQDITDTHAHVLLLMTRSAAGVVPHVAGPKRKAGNSLRRLELIDCPKLTNGTVRSIATLCPRLEQLSLEGCQGISSLDALGPLFQVSETDAGVAPIMPSVASLSLLSMFAPPPAAPAISTTTSRCESPERTPPSNSLQSLFAPPGSSPPRPTPPPANLNPPMLRGPSLARHTSFGNAPGCLQQIDIRDTGITPASFVQTIKTETMHTFKRVQIACIRMEGHGFADTHLDQLSSYLAWNDIVEFVIEPTEAGEPHMSQGRILPMVSTTSSGISLTDAALERWSKEHHFSRMKKLCLVGLTRASARGVARVLEQCPRLEEISLANCPLLFKDPSSVFVLANALGQRRSTLETIDLRNCSLSDDKTEFLTQSLQSSLSSQQQKQQQGASPTILL